MLGFPLIYLVFWLNFASWELCVLVEVWLNNSSSSYLFVNFYLQFSMRQWWTKNTRLNNDGLMWCLCGATQYIVHLITYVPLDLRHAWWKLNLSLILLQSLVIFSNCFLVNAKDNWLVSLPSPKMPQKTTFFILHNMMPTHVNLILFFFFGICVCIKLLCCKILPNYICMCFCFFPFLIYLN